LSESSCCLYFSNSLSRSNLSIRPSCAASYTRVIASAASFFSNRSDRSSVRISVLGDNDEPVCFLLVLLTRRSLSINAADNAPAIEEPAITAISVDIYMVCQGPLEEKLSVVSHDLPLNPIILANPCLRVSTFCAFFSSLMV
jgi:hypothetical protein